MTWYGSTALRMAWMPPLARTSGYNMHRPISERSSMIWNTASSRVASRPAMVITTISASQPPTQGAALEMDEGSEVCAAAPGSALVRSVMVSASQ